MPLIELIYVSIESRLLTDADFKTILQTARTFNSANQITGMLLARDGYFIQALEGEAVVVETLYEKIKQDPRHANVLLISKTTIKERSFKEWSMGFNKIEDADLAALPDFNDFLKGKHEIDYFVNQPSRATRLLERFRDRTYF
jgi:hypothetical protein